MKHCCKNCHFLAKDVVILAPGKQQVHTLTWDADERRNLTVSTNHYARCEQGIWSTRIDPSLKSRFAELLTQDRRDQCFFVEVQDGMSFDGARALHKVRNDNAQLKKSYKLTQIALWIAATGVMGTFIVGVMSFCKAN